MRRKPGKAKPGSLRKPDRMAAAESRSSDALASCCGFSDSGLGCACAEQNPAASPFFRSGIRSKFKAPKTPPSHGLTGFAAIKAGAKKRCFQGEIQNLAAKDWRPEANGPCIPQKDRQRHESAQAAPGFATLFRNPISQPHFATPFRNQGRALFCAMRPQTKAEQPRAAAAAAAAALDGRNARTQMLPGRSPSGGVYMGFCSFFESKFKAPKTPPSHGLAGLAAIKAGAKSGNGFAGAGEKPAKHFAARLWAVLMAFRATGWRPPAT